MRQTVAGSMEPGLRANPLALARRLGEQTACRALQGAVGPTRDKLGRNPRRRLRIS
jgi:hypothetical protein